METGHVKGVREAVLFAFVRPPDNKSLDVVLTKSKRIGRKGYGNILGSTMTGQLNAGEDHLECLIRLLKQKGEPATLDKIIAGLTFIELARSLKNDKNNIVVFGIVISREVLQRLFPELNAVNSSFVNKDRLEELSPITDDTDPEFPPHPHFGLRSNKKKILEEAFKQLTRIGFR